jgi:hypothetical protein
MHVGTRFWKSSGLRGESGWAGTLLNDIAMYRKVYKHKLVDLGNRLTSVVRLDPLQCIGGGVYQGLYYDGSEYNGFIPRHVFITQDAFLKFWEEVEDEST